MGPSCPAMNARRSPGTSGRGRRCGRRATSASPAWTCARHAGPREFTGTDAVRAGTPNPNPTPERDHDVAVVRCALMSRSRVRPRAPGAYHRHDLEIGAVRVCTGAVITMEGPRVRAHLRA